MNEYLIFHLLIHNLGRLFPCNLYVYDAQCHAKCRRDQNVCSEKLLSQAATNSTAAKIGRIPYAICCFINAHCMA